MGYLAFVQELNLDVSTEELLSADSAFAYADLYAMLESGNAVLWLTPHAAVVRLAGRVEYSWWQCRFFFSADGKGMVALSHFPEHLLKICDVLLRVLAASVVHSVILTESNSLLNESNSLHGLINAPSLAYLMEQCQSLKTLTLQHAEALLTG
jgi:hypothetical protein